MALNVADVRRASDIRLPGEDHININTGRIPDGWLELEYSCRDASGNVRWERMCGPATREALEEAYRMRIAWSKRNPITRQEKIDAIRERLGIMATDAEAAAVLDAIEATGHAVVRYRMGGRLRLQIIPTIREKKFQSIVEKIRKTAET